ncbi:MAG: peptidoglycan-binding domain-containing protein [Pseudomonadota bacterium]
MRNANQPNMDLDDFDLDDERYEQSVLVGYMRANPAQTAVAAIAVTAFCIFSVNALFLQTQKHPSAWFETRAPQSSGGLLADERIAREPQNAIDDQQSVTRILIDPQTTALIPTPSQRPQTAGEVYVQLPDGAQPSIDPERSANSTDTQVVTEIQSLLQALGFYNGTVDGLSGPMTNAAIEAYKKSMGLEGVTMTEAQLVNNLRRSRAVVAALPLDDAAGTNEAAALGAEVTAPKAISQRIGPSAADADVMRVQAGLKAFGNSTIVVDGVYGSQTRASIREFQALFELPITGEIDQTLINKMVTIGLID